MFLVSFNAVGFLAADNTLTDDSGGSVLDAEEVSMVEMSVELSNGRRVYLWD